MNQLHLFISGTVQGVGFHQFVKYLSKKRSVTGWVRNLPDSRVEAVLQGQKEVLEEILRRIRKGPLTGKVTAVEVLWEEISTEYPEFSITTLS